MTILAFSERVLWVVGILCVGCCLFLNAQARAYRSLAGQSSEARSSSISPLSEPAMGTIEVQALALSAPIAPDVDADSLRKAVGHIRGTAVPGGLGTVGLAGHRDSFFRPLRHIATEWISSSQEPQAPITT
jgi:sortase A